MRGALARFATLVLASAAVTAFTACERDDGGSTGSQPSARAPAPEPARAADPDPRPSEHPRDPCALLTGDLVRAELDLSAERQLVRRRNDVLPEPRCSLRWKKDDWREIEARNRKRLSEAVQQRVDVMREEGSLDGLPSLRGEPTHNVVSLQIRHVPTAEAARGALDPDAEVIEGLGDAAGWSAEEHRLVVLDGHRIWRVGVRTGEARREREAAVALARKLMASTGDEDPGQDGA